METFLFGPGDRLFGAYYDGMGPPSAPAVLICNGLGQDYMRSQLVLRQLARRLSAIGGPVLQFDYRGTGDSWGNPEDNTLADLREDVTVAREELRAISGRPREVLLGVRLGALLALEQGEQVVAWDPLVSGQDYVSSLDALTRSLCEDREQFPFSRRYERSADPELVGYRYADRLLEALSELTLESVLGGRRYDHLGLVAEEAPSEADGRALLEAHAASFEHFVANPANWNSTVHFERSHTPFPSLGRLCEAISQW